MPLAIVLLFLSVDTAAAPRVVVERESPFGAVFVVDEGHERALRFGAADAADQSVINLRDPHAQPVAYVRALTLAVPYTGAPRDALVVGLGAGSASRALLDAAPRLRVLSVEINPVVVELARSHFGLRQEDRHRVVVDDGARVIARARPASYDIVVLDAYAGDDLPAALVTPAFFAQTKAMLRTGGVVVMNVAVEDAALERKLVARFARAFPACRQVRTIEDNLVVFGSLALPRRALRKRTRAFDATRRVPFALGPHRRALAPCLTDRSGT